MSKWNSLSPSQRLQLLWSAAGLVTIVGGLLWWATRPDWRTLYSGLNPDEARQISTILASTNLTYDVSSDGATLRVPFEQLNKARLATASKASGRTGRLGYELFDKPDWAGSDFDEKVNYQRALEGELEQTIDTLNNVQSSRVHLVLMHDSLFSEAQRSAKASVVLRLKVHQLDQADADAIRNLVASAVDGLAPDHVVLLDADGHGLVGKNAEANSKEVYEQTLAEHLLQTLEPVVGVGNVRATVTVDYNHSSLDEIDESYDPASVVTLSMQRSEQATTVQPPAQGVPGTTSNAPNQQTPLFPSAKAEGQNSKQESGTYGASKKTKHSIEGPGAVMRISAAILVNNHLLPGSDRKKPSQEIAWTPEELKQLTNLSQAAVGYEEARGDKVVVQNLRFDAPAELPVSIFHKIAREAGSSEPVIKDGIIGLLGMIALFFVIRPALRNVPTLAGTTHTLPGEVTVQGVNHPSHPILEGQAQSCFEQVVDQIQRDPVQSARILQTWIRAE